MKLLPKFELKHFDDCSDGELIRFAAQDKTTAYGVVTSRQGRAGEVEKLVAAIFHHSARLEYYSRPQKVLSFGNDWEIRLHDIEFIEGGEFRPAAGAIAVGDSSSYLVLGKAPPQYGGWHSISINGGQFAVRGSAPYIARRWELFLPSANDYQTPTSLLISKVGNGPGLPDDL